MILNNKGFTLVEVLAVVVILGIIGGIAISGVLSSINTSKNTSYKLMVKDIVVASEVLYQEVEFGNTIMEYNTSGVTPNNVSVNLSNEINTNLQTLVSNGYLSGTDKTDNYSSNANKRIIMNPKTKEDIGNCQISIKKNDDVYIVLAVGNDSKCPSTSDYEKGLKSD